MNLVASLVSEYKFKIGERLFPARSVGLDVSKGQRPFKVRTNS
jgi:hypothetical protein